MNNFIDDSINHEYIIRYIRDSIKKSVGLLSELEEFAKDNNVPVSQPETIKMIEVILKICKAQRVLEIGSAIGYSAIRMCRACGADITTIELSPDMAELARYNIKRAGLEEKINLIQGDAKDILPELYNNIGGNQFDVIFVDAAKGQYIEFFKHCIKMLKFGGVLISDNVLYKGMTATDELVIRRKITIVKRLRAYIEMLKKNDELDTAILPIGDGVAISYKIEEELK